MKDNITVNSSVVSVERMHNVVLQNRINQTISEKCQELADDTEFFQPFIERESDPDVEKAEYYTTISSSARTHMA